MHGQRNIKIKNIFHGISDLHGVNNITIFWYVTPYSLVDRYRCDYLIWCVSCTVIVLTCFVMCGFCNVWVFW